MFRNVTGAQEAVIHRQSEDSLIHENHQIKLIKDVQSDDIAKKYPTLKNKWFHERQQLINNLKHLQKHNGFPHEIQHVKSLIECLNELIEHGEVSKHCQILIHNMNKTIQLQPETYVLTKKPLGDKTIRLPRHISKTKIDILNPYKKISSKIFQIDHELNDTEETTTSSSLSTEKKTSGIQFYVVAEQFREQINKKSRKPS